MRAKKQYILMKIVVFLMFCLSPLCLSFLQQTISRRLADHRLLLHCWQVCVGRAVFFGQKSRSFSAAVGNGNKSMLAAYPQVSGSSR